MLATEENMGKRTDYFLSSMQARLHTGKKKRQISGKKDPLWLDDPLPLWLFFSIATVSKAQMKATPN